MRAVIGFLAGLALIGCGLSMRRKENAVTAQTLCATGLLILYAVTFACHAFYHSPAGKARDSQLALFGVAALFFITLNFSR